MAEPTQGKWGLWYIEGSTSGFATKEEAIQSAQARKAGAATKRQSEWAGTVKSGVIVLALIALPLASLSWWKSGSAERYERSKLAAAQRTEDQSRLDALFKCQKEIATVAAYGKQSGPGSTGARKSGDTWQFIWPQGSFHFKNAFGVDVPQWARCEVSAPTGRISRLIVTGRDVILR